MILAQFELLDRVINSHTRLLLPKLLHHRMEHQDRKINTHYRYKHGNSNKKTIIYINQTDFKGFGSTIQAYSIGILEVLMLPTEPKNQGKKKKVLASKGSKITCSKFQ